MKFSERKGFKPLSETIQTRGMDDTLRNSIWNVLSLLVWRSRDFVSSYRGEGPTIWPFSTALWFNYFKTPIDFRPSGAEMIILSIRKYFFSCEWYEVYDFLEFVLNYFKKEGINALINKILERELSGYRFVSGVITNITDEQEINMLESALTDQDFPSVKAHLQTALDLFSNRENPDYRNSIKESISAVESFAQVVTNNPKATLGQALKTLERSGKIHPLLKAAFSKLYGYTSSENGIRHAMIDEPNLSVADARYFLLSCTSFINYMKSKL